MSASVGAQLIQQFFGPRPTSNTKNKGEEAVEGITKRLEHRLSRMTIQGSERLPRSEGLNSLGSQLSRMNLSDGPQGLGKRRGGLGKRPKRNTTKREILQRIEPHKPKHRIPYDLDKIEGSYVINRRFDTKEFLLVEFDNPLSIDNFCERVMEVLDQNQIVPPLLSFTKSKKWIEDNITWNYTQTDSYYVGRLLKKYDKLVKIDLRDFLRNATNDENFDILIRDLAEAPHNEEFNLRTSMPFSNAPKAPKAAPQL